VICVTVLLYYTLNTTLLQTKCLIELLVSLEAHVLERELYWRESFTAH